VIARLPRASPGTAPGVQLKARDPAVTPSGPGPGDLTSSLGPNESQPPFMEVARAAISRSTTSAVVSSDTTKPTPVAVHPAGFARTHGPAAQSGRLDCAGCHAQRFCTSCHQGGGERRYHQLNFVARHASAAYPRETSCASCHNTETFCRSCHQQSGLAGAGTSRRAGAAHGAQPLWLLQHGQAARQGLESCAACHQQTDCLRCHSTVTQRVNPHGPDFNPRRMQARSKIVCGYCHLTDPLR
jgi:hypothetical protein